MWRSIELVQGINYFIEMYLWNRQLVRLGKIFFNINQREGRSWRTISSVNRLLIALTFIESIWNPTRQRAARCGIIFTKEMSKSSRPEKDGSSRRAPLELMRTSLSSICKFLRRNLNTNRNSEELCSFHSNLLQNKQVKLEILITTTSNKWPIT